MILGNIMSFSGEVNGLRGCAGTCFGFSSQMAVARFVPSDGGEG